MRATKWAYVAVIALLGGCGGSGGGGGGGGGGGAFGDSTTTAPLFRGVRCIATAGGATVRLDWAAGQDNRTVPSALTYRVFVSSTSGTQNFATPILTTAAGATTASVTSAHSPLIAVGARAFFVVRAVDGDGNLDDNQVELSVTPCATGNVAYVDAAAAGPGALGNPANPFTTIQAGVDAVEAAGNGAVLVAAPPIATTYNQEVTIGVPAVTFIGVFGGFPAFAALPPAPTPQQVLNTRAVTTFATPADSIGLPLVDGDFWAVLTAGAPTYVDGFTFQGAPGFALRATDADLQVSCCTFLNDGQVSTLSLAPAAVSRLRAVANTSEVSGTYLFVPTGLVGTLAFYGNRTIGRTGLVDVSNILVPEAGMNVRISHNFLQTGSSPIRISFDPQNPADGGPLDILVERNDLRDNSGNGVELQDIGEVGLGGACNCVIRRNLIQGTSSQAIDLRVLGTTTYPGVDVAIVVEDNDILGNNGSCVEADLGVSANQTTSLSLIGNRMSNSEVEMVEVDDQAPSAIDLSDGGRIVVVMHGNTNVGAAEDLIDWDMGTPHGGSAELLVTENTVMSSEDPMTVRLQGHIGTSSIVRPFPDGAHFVTIFNNDLGGNGDDEALEIRDQRGSNFLGGAYVYVGANLLAPTGDDSDPSIDFDLNGSPGSWLFERNVHGFHGQDSSEDGFDMDGSTFPSLVRLRNSTMAMCSGDGLELSNSGPKPQFVNLTIAYNGQNGANFGVDSGGSRGNTFIHNSIIANHNKDLHADVRVSYSQTTDVLPTGGFGNLRFDPIFGVGIDALDAFPQDFATIAANLFRLSPTSPGVDAGDPDPAQNDPDGSRNDMGAFGGPCAGPVGVRAAGTAVPMVWIGTDPGLHLYTGALLVAPATPVAFAFTRPVAPATLAAGILVSNGGVPVPGAFTTDFGGRRVIFTPATVLNPTAGTAVTVRFTTALQDTSANALACPDTLRFAVAGTPSAESEPNDDNDGDVDAADVALADPLGLGAGAGSAVVDGAMAAGTDCDVYSFSAVAGDRIMATVLGSRGASDATRLVVVDATGAQLAQSDNFSFGSDPYLDWTAPSTGTFYVGVIDSGASGVGGGIYQLQVVRD